MSSTSVREVRHVQDQLQIRAALTHTSEVIPSQQGRLALGTWQGIYVWEHRQQGQVRQIVVHLSGS